MNTKMLMIGVSVVIFSVGQVYAGEMHDHGEMMEGEDTMMEDHATAMPNVGNKICPVSGEVIAEVDDGKGIQVEYEGKVYNLCCKMCVKDFKKDPEKFIAIVEDELASEEESFTGQEDHQVMQMEHEEHHH